MNYLSMYPRAIYFVSFPSALEPVMNFNNSKLAFPIYQKIPSHLILLLFLSIQLVEDDAASNLVSVGYSGVGSSGLSGQRISNSRPLSFWNLSYHGSNSSS